MATIDHQAWLDALRQVQANSPAYGFDPSWFVQDQVVQTAADRLEQMKRDYLAQNPGARDWSPQIKEAERSLSMPETFGNLVMTQEGARAYDDLLTKKNRADDLSNVITTASLAALPFAASAFMAPATGTLGAAGGEAVTSLASPSGLGLAPSAITPEVLASITAPVAGIEAGSLGAGAVGALSGLGYEAPSLLGSVAAELTAPLSMAGSEAAAAQLALGGIPELGASIGTLGGLGYESPSLLGSVSPELTAPLSTAGSDAAFGQLFAEPVLSPNIGIPNIAEPSFRALPELGNIGKAVTPSLLDNIGSALPQVGSKLIDAATTPQGLAAIGGALAGGLSGGGDKTSSVQNNIDPRMQQYLYGTGYGDPASFLGAAQRLYQSNPTGINPTMQQGLDMQRSALTDPGYAQSYQQMRSIGQGLLSGTQSPTVQAGGGLLTPQDRFKTLLSRGQGLING